MSKDPIEFTKKLLEAYSKEYKERLELLYPEAYEENPEAFPLSDSSNLDAYIIKGNEKLIIFPRWIIVYQGEGVITDLGEIEEDYYSELKNYSSGQAFISHVISKKTNINKQLYFDVPYHLHNFLINSYETSDKYIFQNKSQIGNDMLSLLKSDGQRFRKHIDEKASYYARDAFRFVYSELDFMPIIQAVGDPDFEYALNESIAAYDNSLYLAAVSTAGTALEALMIRMIELEGLGVNESGTTELGELSSRLKNSGVIAIRDKRRIMLAAQFRNLASHANKGRVIRQDAKLLYQEIFNLASDYFKI